MREILQRFLLLPAINYFDDFPHVDAERMIVRSQVVTEEAFRVLGWGIAEEAKKRTPPSKKFVVLRVVSEEQGGQRTVTELEATIAEMEALGTFPPATAVKV